jgi:hypothetical protein
MGFLKTLLIIFLIYFLLRIIGRLLAPRVFRYAVKKTEDRFREAFEQAQGNADRGFSGPGTEIRDRGEKQNPKSADQVGEYIDFEEIE